MGALTFVGNTRIILNCVGCLKDQIKIYIYIYGVAEPGVELLNDEAEIARSLVEKSVAEDPARLRRELLLDMAIRHFQLQQQVYVTRVCQNLSQTAHFLHISLYFEI